MSGHPTPLRRGRVRLMLAILGAVAGVMLTTATGAFGFWLATSTENPSAAIADTLPAGSTPTAVSTVPTPNSTTVSFTLPPVSRSNGQVAIPAENYRITRYEATTGGAAQPTLATCVGTTTVECSESEVPDGTWRYTSTPIFGQDWVGPESSKSASVIVDTTPPVVPAPVVVGGYVNSLSVPVSLGIVTDAGAGVSAVTLWRATASLANGTCGAFGASTEVALTSGTDTSVESGSCYQYQQRATDNVGNASNSDPSGTVKVDTTAPIVQAPTVAAGYVNTLSVPVGLGTVEETGSGISTTTLQRASADLASGTCSPFATFAAITLTSGSDVGVASGKCYQYRVQATDNAGNVGTSPDSGIVKVDTSAPTVPTLSFSALSNVSVTGSTVYYRSTASSGGFTVKVTPADSESGIASYSFPNLGGGWTPSGSADTRTYSWGAANPPTNSGSLTVTATNNAGQTSSASFTLAADATGPSVPQPSVTSGYVTAASVPVSLGTVTDSGSGVNSSTLAVWRASATLSNGACGAFSPFTAVTLSSGTDTSAVSGNCYQYQQRATDNVGNAATSAPSNIARFDNTPPTVPTPTVAASYVTTLSVPVALGTVTDSGSGVNATTVTALRAVATLAAGNCAAFGSFTPVTLVGGADTGVISGRCYQYQQRAADNAGNLSTSTTSNTVKVDTSAPSTPTWSFQSLNNVFVSAGRARIYYRRTAPSGSFTMTANSTDAESGIASYSFPSLGTGWTSTGTGASRNYAWSAASPLTTTSAITLRATNGAGTLSNVSSSYRIVPDVTAPAGGALTVNGVAAGTAGTTSYLTGTTLALSGRTDFSETQNNTRSGLASSTLTIQSAPLVNDTCGSFGAPTTIIGVTPPAVASGTCYLVTLTGTDNVGNSLAISSTVKVDTTPPTISSAVLGNGGTSGRIDQGDTLTITFSEPLKASGLCSSWTSNTTPYSVGGSTMRVANGTAPTTDKLVVQTTAPGCTPISFGSLDLGSSSYVTGNVDFINSTLAWDPSTRVLKLTLGSGGSVSLSPPAAMSYTNGSGTDPAGNPLSNSPFTPVTGAF